LSYTPPRCILPRGAASYLVSRCSWCCRQRGQNLFSSMRPGSFLLFFRVLYVRSLQTVHANAITGRFSALATWFSFPSFPPVAAIHHRGSAATLN